MASIDRQIDEAVVLMKARAAEFDGDYQTKESRHVARFIDRAFINLRRARKIVGMYWRVSYFVAPATGKVNGDPLAAGVLRRDLLDTMNLCALALSLLPKGGGT